MGFAEAAIQFKACLVVLPLALLLQIIGVATNFWLSKDSSNCGLWKCCGDSLCLTIDSVTDGLPGWWTATRAFAIIGVLVLVASVALAAMCVFVFTLSERKIIYIIHMMVAYCGAAVIFLSIVIFGAKFTSDDAPAAGLKISWSFGLSIVGGILALFGAIFVTLGIVKNSSP